MYNLFQKVKFQHKSKLFFHDICIGLLLCLILRQEINQENNKSIFHQIKKTINKRLSVIG